MISVSVVIPSYNHSQYIEETLISCLEQDYEGFIEIFIIDDCSTDTTKEILSVLDFSKYKNRKVSIVYKEKNKGINDSINIGLSTAKGKYVQILASDDVLCLNKISTQVDFLEEHDCDCVYSRGFIYSKDSCKEYYLEDFKKMLSLDRGLEFVSTKDWGGPLTQSGLFKLDLLLKIQDIRASYKSDDWAMLISIFKTYKPGYYDEPLFYYRQHDDNTYSKYWLTLPMRVDVASRLIDNEYKLKALSNICLSHSEYLIADDKKFDSFKFLIASSALGFTSLKIRSRVLLRCILPNSIWPSIVQFKRLIKYK